MFGGVDGGSPVRAQLDDLTGVETFEHADRHRHRRRAANGPGTPRARARFVDVDPKGPYDDDGNRRGNGPERRARYPS